MKIGIYVSLFVLGHSATLLFGVSFQVGINSYVIDAIIGLSVVYKALDKWARSSVGSVPARYQSRDTNLRLFPRLRSVDQDHGIRIAAKESCPTSSH